MKNISLRKTTSALLLSTAIGIFASAITPIGAFAQTLYWDGTNITSGDSAPIGGAGTWGAASNWTDDALGTNNQTWASGGDAVFGGAAGGDVILDGNQTIGNLTFSTTGYDIQGAGDLIVNGVSTFDVTGSQEISAKITGIGGFDKQGTGTLTLSGTNNYTGDTNITSGTLTLAIGGGSAIGNSSAVDVSAGSTLNVYATEIIGSLNGGGTVNIANGQYLRAGINNDTTDFSGLMNSTGTFEKQGAGNMTFSGDNNSMSRTYIYGGQMIITGSNFNSSNGFYVQNGGTLVVNNASGNAINDDNEITVNNGGLFQIQENETIGSLYMYSGGEVNIASGKNLTFGNDDDNHSSMGIFSGDGGLIKQGAATQYFMDTNTYTGATTINGGIMDVRGSLASTSINVNAGGTLRVDGASLDDLSTVTLSGNGILDLTGNETIGVLSSSSATSSVTLNANSLTLNSGNPGFFAGDISGDGGLIKQGLGGQILSGANAYTGATTVNAGTLNISGSIASTSIEINNTGALNAAGGAGSIAATAIDLNNSATFSADAGVLTSGANIDLSGTSTFENNGDNIISSVTTIAGTTINLDADTLTTGNANDQEIAGLITGGGSLTKQGTGTLTISGANDYSGSTSVNGGIMNVTGSLASTSINVNAGGTLRVDGASLDDLSTVTLNGNGILDITSNETIGSLEGVGTVNISAGQTLTAGSNNTNTEYSGLMSNAAGRFIKEGTGNMEFSGDDNLLTTTTINDGTMTITGSNFTSGTSFIVGNGGTLVANNAGGNAINDANAITVLLGGTFEVQTNETVGYIGGTGDVYLNGANLTFGNGSDFNSTGTISGDGGLIKQGTGTQTLSGANTYTGATSVNAGIMNVTGSIASSDINIGGTGTLQVDASAFVGATAPANINLSGTGTFQNNGDNSLEINSLTSVAGTTIDLAAGVLSIDMASDQEFAGLLTGAGDLVKQGAGTLTLSGDNDLTGGISIDAGTLTLSGDNDLTGGITVAGGTLSLQSNNAAGGADNTITTTGSTIDYANSVNSATLIDINSNTTKLQVLTGTAEQSGVISEIGGVRPLEKIGAGELILSATNTYTGLTTISAGTLSLNNGAAIHDSGDVLVGSAGTLNLMASETIAAMNNAGAINLQNGAVGNNLTLTGDYTGVGIINVDVDFSTDVSDQLIIGGNVTGGTTTISVNDISTGAATGNDVLVVDVAGTSNVGDFTLAGGNITSGAYTYALDQIGMDWFLTQALSPLTATFEIYPQTLSALNTFSSLRSRTSSRFYKNGGEYNSDKNNGGGVGVGSKATNGDKYYNGNIWGIIEASHAKVTPTSSTTASTYETSIWKIKAGVDGLVYDNADGKFLLSFNGYYGTASSNITSTNGNGSIFTQGFGVGLSATYFSNSGFYLDGQLQAGWNYSDLNSVASGALITDNLGQTYAASLEIGQKFNLGNGLNITPNAQLSYSNIKFDNFTATGGEVVALDYADNLVTRLGVIVENDQSWIGDDGKENLSSLYGLANIYYNFSGASQVDVSGTKLTTQANRWSGEIGLGGSYNFGGNKYALSGEATLASSFANFGNDYQVKGNLGFKAKF